MTIRHRALLLALAGVLTASQRVTAQTRVIQSGTTDSGFAAGDVAYDPKHDVYLFVYERCPWFNNHCPQGRIISGDGTTYGSGPFEIGTSAPNGGGQVSAVYSPDLSDGQGGTGAFLVAWTTWDTDLVWRVYARVISLNGPVAPKIVVNEWRAGTPEGLINAAVAYSSTDRTFLVGWIVIFDYYKSGFYRDIQPYYVRLDVNGQPIGPMRAVNLAHDSPCFSAT